MSTKGKVNQLKLSKWSTEEPINYAKSLSSAQGNSVQNYESSSKGTKKKKPIMTENSATAIAIASRRGSSNKSDDVLTLSRNTRSLQLDDTNDEGVRQFEGEDDDDDEKESTLKERSNETRIRLSDLLQFDGQKSSRPSYDDQLSLKELQSKNRFLKQGIFRIESDLNLEELSIVDQNFLNNIDITNYVNEVFLPL